jgi:hypothetical protein
MFAFATPEQCLRYSHCYHGLLSQEPSNICVDGQPVVSLNEEVQDQLANAPASGMLCFKGSSLMVDAGAVVRIYFVYAAKVTK